MNLVRLNLLGAAADHVANEHADGQDQRRSAQPLCV